MAFLCDIPASFDPRDVGAFFRGAHVCEFRCVGRPMASLRRFGVENLPPYCAVALAGKERVENLGEERDGYGEQNDAANEEQGAFIQEVDNQEEACFDDFDLYPFSRDNNSTDTYAGVLRYKHEHKDIIGQLNGKKWSTNHAELGRCKIITVKTEDLSPLIFLTEFNRGLSKTLKRKIYKRIAMSGALPPAVYSRMLRRFPDLLSEEKSLKISVRPSSPSGGRSTGGSRIPPPDSNTAEKIRRTYDKKMKQQKWSAFGPPQVWIYLIFK